VTLKKHNLTFKHVNINKGLYLTELRLSDADVFIQCCNDPVLYINTCCMPKKFTNSDFQHYFDYSTSTHRKHGHQVNWAIRNNQDLLLGVIAFLNIKKSPFLKSEIGFWLAKPFRNQGIMNRVIRSFIQLSFFYYSFQCLEAIVFVHNEPSLHVLMNNGFKKKQFLPKQYEKDGKLIDAWHLQNLAP